MSRTKPRASAPRSTELDDARNELFSHIHRCGVIRATEEQQIEWMEDTIAFLGERFPSLGEEELGDLRSIGLRFCRPVINAAPAAPDAEEVETEDEAIAEEATAA